MPSVNGVSSKNLHVEHSSGIVPPSMSSGKRIGLISSNSNFGSLASVPGVGIGMAVRRLTPRECERLQGFPDDYTAITVRGKPAADGPRYKALGNSMAVPVMAWIGLRIQMVEQAVPRSPTPSPR